VAFGGDLEPRVFPSSANTVAGKAEFTTFTDTLDKKLIAKVTRFSVGLVLMRSGYSGSQKYGMIPWVAM
jgi:hypothetical protein